MQSVPQTFIPVLHRYRLQPNQPKTLRILDWSPLPLVMRAKKKKNCLFPSGHHFLSPFLFGVNKLQKTVQILQFSLFDCSKNTFLFARSLEQAEPHLDLVPVLWAAQLVPVARVGDCCCLLRCQVEGERLLLCKQQQECLQLHVNNAH
jgi:hypothetical protein